MVLSEEEERIAFCKKHNVHHLFELLATKLLVDRPENLFDYLRQLLTKVEESEKKKSSYDPTVIPSSVSGDVHLHKKITLGTFGLNNAGKTTIISALGGKIDVNTTPTMGFTPTRFQTDKCDICIFDLGGASNFRGIWVHYFYDCHGFMFVIDSAANDVVVQESIGALRGLVEHPHAKGKPLLVLANKKDLDNSRGVEVVSKAFFDAFLEADTAYRVVASCGIKEDTDLEEGVEWLLTTVGDRYETLNARVLNDSEEVKKGANKKIIKEDESEK